MPIKVVMSTMSFEELKQAVVEGNTKAARALSKKMAKNPKNIDQAIDRGIKKALDIVGEKFSKGEYFIPDIMLSVIAANTSFKIFKPFFKKKTGESAGTILVGTVEGDIHDIGKNIVTAMLQAAGFDVIDLGVDVPPGKFVAAIKKSRPAVVGISALLSTALVTMEKTIDEIKREGLREQVKIIVGGGAVTPEFAKEIGADRYGLEATDAPAIARELIMGQTKC
jgi:5-methyltetrahydrofolate--homocysteine methyltransferase